MTQRRHARECALEVFYRYDITNEDTGKTRDEILKRTKFSPEGKIFFCQLIDTTASNLTTIDKAIKLTLQYWSFSRLSVVDRAILRIACCELLYFTDIPPKVVINEALEIAKKFSSGESSRFVNGILDAIYKTKKDKTAYSSE